MEKDEGESDDQPEEVGEEDEDESSGDEHSGEVDEIEKVEQ